jgi:proteasome lid subunit RPN8/RPN11
MPSPTTPQPQPNSLNDQPSAVSLPAFDLPPEALSKLRQHAEACYPNEACGAVFGLARTITGVRGLQNVSASPRTSFLVTARDTLGAAHEAEARGEELLGFYHSHVDAGPALSPADRALLKGWRIAVIVEVVRGRARRLEIHDLSADCGALLARPHRQEALSVCGTQHHLPQEPDTTA